MSLFRSEALAEAAPSHFGEVVLAQPPRIKWLSFGVFVLALLLVPFLIFGKFSRSQTVLGFVAPHDGMGQVHAMQSGTVSGVFVQEGDIVEKGDVIFEISSELTNAAESGVLSEQLQEIDRRIRERRLQGELTRQRFASRIERVKRSIESVESDIVRLEAQKSISDRNLSLSQAQWERWREAGMRGVLADSELEAREQDFLDAKLASVEFERTIASRTEELAELHHSLETMEIDSVLAESRTRSELASLTQSRSDIEGAIGRKITAPIAGRMTAIQATVGQSVRAALPMALILPVNETLHVRLYAPTRTAGFIEANQPVRLRVDAFPYQRFGSLSGKISQVSGTALSPTEVVSPVPVTESVYRLTVELDKQEFRAYGDSQALQSGMTVQADLIIDERPLWRWVMDPVLARSG